MKILMTTGIFPPDVGGPASYVPAMARALLDRGHVVQVLCLADEVRVAAGLYPFPVWRISGRIFKPWRELQTLLKIYRLALGVDLIYVSGLAFESAWAAMLARRPAVHKVVSDYAWERAFNRGWFTGSRDEYQTAPKNWKLRLIDWIRVFPLRHAAMIITPSRYLQQLIGGWKIPVQKIQVVYNAVAFSETLKSPMSVLPEFAGKTLITVGRLIAIKNVDQIIQILPQLPDFRLVILGDGPLRGQLEKQARDLQVAGRVIFVGHVAHDAVAAYLRQSQVFVLNSMTEGLPHVAIEAMAAGVPVVATDTGGTPEVVRDGQTGWLVPVGQPQMLFAAIQTVAAGGAEVQRRIQNAQNSVIATFSYPAMVTATEKILQAAARSGSL